MKTEYQLWKDKRERQAVCRQKQLTGQETINLFSKENMANVEVDYSKGFKRK